MAMSIGEMRKAVGEMIREMRKAAGMSQQRLADKIGVSYQQVQKYEKGTSQLNMRRLKAIADAFGVHITVFLTDDVMGTQTKSTAAGSNLTEEEGRLLMLFRRLKRKKLRDSFMGMLKDIVKLTETR